MAVSLGFDTSQAACAAALSLDGRVRVRIEDMARGQAERLMGVLEEMLAAEGLVWGDLDVIGVGIGPGNFTGIRIGVAAARGLAMALRIPAVGVSAFEAAAGVSARPLWVAVPAPRGQVWLQRLAPGGRETPTLVPQEALAGLDAPLLRAEERAGEARIATIARLALERRGESPPRPAPLYARAPDAAPARDAPPVILP